MEDIKTIEGTETFNVNDGVQGSHAVSINNLKDFIQNGFLFQVGIPASAHIHWASLTGNEARYLIENTSGLLPVSAEGQPFVIITTDLNGMPGDEHTHDLTVFFDYLNHTFIVTNISNNEFYNHEAHLIGTVGGGGNPSNSLWAQLEVDANNPTATDDTDPSLNRLVGMDTYYPFLSISAAVTYANKLLVNGVVTINCLSHNDVENILVERNSSIEIYFNLYVEFNGIVIENYGNLTLVGNGNVLQTPEIENYGSLTIRNASSLRLGSMIRNRSKLNILSCDSILPGINDQSYSILLYKGSYTSISDSIIDFSQNLSFIIFDGDCTLYTSNVGIINLSQYGLYFAQKDAQNSVLYFYLTDSTWDQIVDANSEKPLLFSGVVFNSNSEWYPAYNILPGYPTLVNNRSKVKTFKGFLSQDDNNVPTIRIVENLLGFCELDSIHEGRFSLQILGAFNNNTIVRITDNTEEMRFIFKAKVVDSNIIEIITAEYSIVDGALEAVPLNGLLYNSPITIEVYPE